MKVRVVRTYGGDMRSVVHEHVDTIVSLTPTRAYFERGSGYIERSTGLVKPRYLDYITRAVPVPESVEASGG